MRSELPLEFQPTYFKSKMLHVSKEILSSFVICHVWVQFFFRSLQETNISLLTLFFKITFHTWQHVAKKALHNLHTSITSLLSMECIQLSAIRRET